MNSKTPITNSVARSDGNKFWDTEIVDAEQMRRLELVLHSMAGCLMNHPCKEGIPEALTAYRALLPTPSPNR